MTNHYKVMKDCLYFTAFTLGVFLKNDLKRTQQKVSKYSTAVNMPVSTNIY